MNSKKGKIQIGTSGWVYSHWYEIFYPEDIKSTELLQFYAKHFKTVEVNTSFYHLPKVKTFSNWYAKTPPNFLFTVKASRFITHIRKLNNCQEPWQKFIDSAQNLKEKLGPILFQLPPHLQANTEKLKSFLKILPHQYLYAFEFRDLDWFIEEIYHILKKHKIALVWADSPDYPYKEVITSHFIYIRFHGSQNLYSSKYSDQELKSWAIKIKKWQKQGLDIYAYFNNDYEGYALENAKKLEELTN